MSKRNISFSKPAEPPFLKRLKEKIGYKEGPTVETKKEQLPIDNDVNDEIDDEKPVIVVLEPNDLSEEQVKEYQEGYKKNSEKIEKIVFRKPEKRAINESSHLICSSKKIKESESKIKSVDKSKQVKNSSLLSFDDDDEEEQ